MRTHRHDASGFSLAEILVVLVVFGILAAVTVPGVSGYLRSARVEGAAGTLAADLRLARSLASAQRSSYAMTFDGDSYSLVRVSSSEVVLRRKLPRGVAFTAPDTTTFFAWGLTEPATLTITDERRTSTVRLLATGSVSHD